MADLPLPQQLVGQTKHYQGNGRQLGYPTANIDVKTDLADGVYFGHADLATYTDRPAIIFIGIPTTMGDTERRVEVHVLDIPDVDYYDQELRVSIEHFHRSNRTLDSVDELLVLMDDDKAQALRWFAAHDGESH